MRYQILIVLAVCLSSAGVYGDAVHILAPGETLYSLSRRYGVSLEEILVRNNISDPSVLPVGTRLLIPGPSGLSIEKETAYYTVQKGDTYYSIARSHGLEVDRLLSLNGRSVSSVLKVGEILIVGPSGSERPKNTGTALTVSAEPFSNRPVNVSDVPWWPVAGTKRPLEGKLTGVAIETDSLSYVHAVAGGQVVWTGPYRGFGHVVLVDSNGYIYLYGGNEDLFVNVGQSITAGSRIGRLGSSGPDGGKKDMIFSVFREGVPVSPDEAPRG